MSGFYENLSKENIVRELFDKNGKYDEEKCFFKAVQESGKEKNATLLVLRLHKQSLIKEKKVQQHFKKSKNVKKSLKNKKIQKQSTESFDFNQNCIPIDKDHTKHKIKIMNLVLTRAFEYMINIAKRIENEYIADHVNCAKDCISKDLYKEYIKKADEIKEKRMDLRIKQHKIRQKNLKMLHYLEKYKEFSDLFKCHLKMLIDDVEPEDFPKESVYYTSNDILKRRSSCTLVTSKKKLKTSTCKDSLNLSLESYENKDYYNDVFVGTKIERFNFLPLDFPQDYDVCPCCNFMSQRWHDNISSICDLIERIGNENEKDVDFINFINEFLEYMDEFNFNNLNLCLKNISKINKNDKGSLDANKKSESQTVELHENCGEALAENKDQNDFDIEVKRFRRKSKMLRKIVPFLVEELHYKSCLHRKIIDITEFDAQNTFSLKYLKRCSGCINVNVEWFNKQIEIDKSIFYAKKHTDITGNQSDVTSNTQCKASHIDHEIKDEKDYVLKSINCAQNVEYSSCIHDYLNDNLFSKKYGKEIQYFLNSNNTSQRSFCDNDNSIDESNQDIKIPMVFEKILKINIRNIDENSYSIPIWFPEQLEIHHVIKLCTIILENIFPEYSDRLNLYHLYMWVKSTNENKANYRVDLTDFCWSQNFKNIFIQSKNYYFSTEDAIFHRELSNSKSDKVIYELFFPFFEDALLVDMYLNTNVTDLNDTENCFNQTKMPIKADYVENMSFITDHSFKKCSIENVEYEYKKYKELSKIENSNDWKNGHKKKTLKNDQNYHHVYDDFFIIRAKMQNNCNLVEKLNSKENRTQKILYYDLCDKLSHFLYPFVKLNCLKNTKKNYLIYFVIEKCLQCFQNKTLLFNKQYNDSSRMIGKHMMDLLSHFFVIWIKNIYTYFATINLLNKKEYQNLIKTTILLNRDEQLIFEEKTRIAEKEKFQEQKQRKEERRLLKLKKQNNCVDNNVNQAKQTDVKDTGHNNSYKSGSVENNKLKLEEITKDYQVENKEIGLPLTKCSFEKKSNSNMNTDHSNADDPRCIPSRMQPEASLLGTELTAKPCFSFDTSCENDNDNLKEFTVVKYNSKKPKTKSLNNYEIQDDKLNIQHNSNDNVNEMFQENQSDMVHQKKNEQVLNEFELKRKEFFQNECKKLIGNGKTYVASSDKIQSTRNIHFDKHDRNIKQKKNISQKVEQKSIFNSNDKFPKKNYNTKSNNFSKNSNHGPRNFRLVYTTNESTDEYIKKSKWNNFDSKKNQTVQRKALELRTKSHDQKETDTETKLCIQSETVDKKDIENSKLQTTKTNFVQRDKRENKNFPYGTLPRAKKLSNPATLSFAQEVLPATGSKALGHEQKTQQPGLRSESQKYKNNLSMKLDKVAKVRPLELRSIDSDTKSQVFNQTKKDCAKSMNTGQLHVQRTLVANDEFNQSEQSSYEKFYFCIQNFIKEIQNNTNK